MKTVCHLIEKSPDFVVKGVVYSHTEKGSVTRRSQNVVIYNKLCLKSPSFLFLRVFCHFFIGAWSASFHIDLFLSNLESLAGKAET